MNLPVLDISLQWSLPMFVFFYLAYSSYHNASKIYLCWSMYQNFISIFGWIIFHPIYITYFSFTYLLMDTCNCLYLMGTGRNTIKNPGIQVYIWVSIFNSFCYILRNGYIIILCWVFSGLPKLFFTVATPFYIHYSNVQVCKDSTFSMFIIFSLLLVILVGVNYHIVVLIWISLIIYNIELIFICFGHCISSLEKYQLKSFTHI